MMGAVLRSATLAVDAMGGDHGLAVTIPATLAFLRQYAQAKVILVGDEQAILANSAYPTRDEDAALLDRLNIHPASEVIAMDEPVASALRNKKDSSMRVAIDLVKTGAAEGCLSAGNTGALMAIARFVLKTLPGIERPAIASALPSLTGQTTMLDLGANVDCTAEHLYQFALMGSALVAAVEDKESPRVGLLNVGEEEIKGNEIVKAAAERLKASTLNFYGNVEGDDIYRGTVDVVVCDGFVGNIALKTSEGLAQLLNTLLKEEFQRGLLGKLAALVALPVLKRFKNRVDPRQYNGASLLGLRGLVMKSHGSADAYAFQFALERLYREASQDVLSRISEHLAAANGSNTLVGEAIEPVHV